MALSLDRDDLFYIETIRKGVKERGKRRNEVNPIQFTKEFPECLIYEILSWLPVKSLVRFKSVCKSWRIMIKTKSFVSKHMQQRYYHSKDDKCRNCLIIAYNMLPNEFWWYQYLLNKNGRRVLAYTEIYRHPPSNHLFCGPCDGLYYVSDPFRDDRRHLWNPTLKDRKYLPPIVSKHDLPSNRYFAFWDNNYGFGFDPVSKDYKVVLIKDILDGSNTPLEKPPGVLVYSLKTNSWKYVADLSKYYELRDNKSYIFAKTSLYWLASEKTCFFGNQVIIAFNLATDECREIQLPGQIDEHGRANECLMVYHGNMAFVKVDHNKKFFSVWALKKGKWANNFQMGLHFWVRKPLGHWRDGLLMFLTYDGRNLLICNLDTLKSWILKIRSSDSCYGVEGICAYEESLVSLN